MKKKNDDKALTSKELNATFADLPAPNLQWEEMAEAPVPRLDGAAIQIKNLLYVFAGYGTIDYVRIILELKVYWHFVSYYSIYNGFRLSKYLFIGDVI